MAPPRVSTASKARASPRYRVARLVPRSEAGAALIYGLLSVALLLALVPVLLIGAMAESEAQGSCPAGSNVPSSVDLGQPTIDAINALKPLYEQVATEKDIPWSLLASLDYRENSNAPDKSTLSGEDIGTPNPDNPSITTTSKLDSIQKAADHFRSLASSVYGVSITAASGGEDIKLGQLAFNRGFIYKWANVGPDASVYVMNNYGPGYESMTWAAIEPGAGDPRNPGEPLRGRQEIGRYGAYTVFTRLGGSTAGGCGGLSNIDVVRVAQGELGTSETNPGSDCDCGAVMKYQGSGGPEDWCADFVSWVFNTAGQPFDGGTDGGWRLPGVRQLRAWMISHGTYEERSSHALGDALPGDVVIFGGGEGTHTGIVETVDGADTPDPGDDVLHTIEGNSGDMVRRRDYQAGDAYVAGWGTGPVPAPVV